MKIGIDIRPLTLNSSGGVSQLVKGVCERTFFLYENHCFFVFCTPFNRELVLFEGANVKHVVLPISTYYQDVDQIAVEESIDVLFRSYPIEDTLKFPSNKQIYLIPDIQHEKFPEFFSEQVLNARRSSFSKALKGSGAIGTISEFARKTLLDFPGSCCTDVFLMEPALQVAHRNVKKSNLTILEVAAIPHGDYFIFPANIWKHKNHLGLLEAFEIFIAKSGRDVQLVLTGYQEGWSELAQRFPNLPVVHLGFVRPEFLRLLLEHAKALVFFSLYEGFGMPLLEAFNAGTPVICSNTTSLPEVGQDAVLSCDPTDVSAIAELMERVLDDVQLRNELIRRGKDRVNAYSWDNAARNLIAACERVKTRSDCFSQIAPITVKQDPVVREPQPLVSIITPSYNQGQFLQRTIESVVLQNYSNIEYFVFDGGSTDNSIDILKSYGDQFFWISSSDEGQTDAINKGMRLAKGEILAYLNSDDVLLPGAIEKVVKFFNQNPECDLVYGNAFYIDENDKVIGSYKTAEYSLNRLVEDCMICQPAAFWRNRVKEKIGLFDQTLNYAMDYDYWLRIATQCGNICFLPDTLACSRFYPETKTCSARSEVYAEIFKVSIKNVGYVHENYYQGLWHHLIFEKNNMVSKLLRLHPESYISLYKVHYKLSGIWQGSPVKTAQYVFRKVCKKLNQWFQNRSRFTIFHSKHVSTDLVNGYWPDNWLSPEVTIPIRNTEISREFYIAGVAPVNLVATIYSGRKKIGQFRLSANQNETIKLSSSFLTTRPLKLRFSRYVKDSSYRKISFLLEATNLFSERDIS